MWRRLLRLCGWILPPLAFGGWGYHFYTVVRLAAIPAFGPVQKHLDSLANVIRKDLVLGGLVVVFWVGCWSLVYRSRRSTDAAKGGRNSTEARERRENLPL